MDHSYIPEGYESLLDIGETETAIKYVKDTFEKIFSESMDLLRVSAPLFVERESGLNDNLNGVERPVGFDARDVNGSMEIVHSLAKWKRMALARYGFKPGQGLYTDMNAIRRDEDVDNLHSIYVDQWDWEKVITKDERNMDYLKDVVRVIVRALAATDLAVCAMFKRLSPRVDPEVFFVTTQELENMYPNLTPKQRENAVTKAHHTVFISQIGDTLLSGAPHDGRAPDYDDWALNGDIIVWNEMTQGAFEISSMGIRVNEESLRDQLSKARCEDRAKLPFHTALLNGQLPLTIGGGIGQSRICMLMLEKCHIGEVQASVWPENTRRECADKGVFLL